VRRGRDAKPTPPGHLARRRGDAIFKMARDLKERHPSPGRLRELSQSAERTPTQHGSGDRQAMNRFALQVLFLGEDAAQVFLPGSAGARADAREANARALHYCGALSPAWAAAAEGDEGYPFPSSPSLIKYPALRSPGAGHQRVVPSAREAPVVPLTSLPAPLPIQTN
jgi:hypothetical protein